MSGLVSGQLGAMQQFNSLSRRGSHLIRDPHLRAEKQDVPDPYGKCFLLGFSNPLGIWCTNITQS